MILVALVVLTWLLVAPSLGWLMRRHGYDAVPWFLLGLISAPLAVILACAELLRPTSYCPRVLASGQVRHGSLDVLVNLDSSPESVEAAAKILAHLLPRLRSLGLTRVLPRGVGRLAEERNAAELRRDAAALGVPGAHLVLLFGRPEQALRQYAATANYSLVVTTGQPGLAHALRESHLAAAEATDITRILSTASMIESPIRRIRLHQVKPAVMAQKTREEREMNPSPGEPSMAVPSGTAGPRAVTDTRRAP